AGWEAVHVAGAQRHLAVRDSDDKRPADDEQPFLVVLVVVRRRALPRLEVVGEHEHVPGSGCLRDVDPAFRALGIEDVDRHAAILPRPERASYRGRRGGLERGGGWWR